MASPSPPSLWIDGDGSMEKRGFTLIELVVVVAILVTIITLGYLGLSNYLTKAYNITAKHDLMSFVKAQEVYRATYGRYLGAQGDYMEGGDLPTGSLSRDDLKYAPSKGVRIEIVSGDGAAPNGPPTFRAEASHPSADMIYTYDFSMGETSERNK